VIMMNRVRVALRLALIARMRPPCACHSGDVVSKHPRRPNDLSIRIVLKAITSGCCSCCWKKFHHDVRGLVADEEDDAASGAGLPLSEAAEAAGLTSPRICLMFERSLSSRMMHVRREEKAGVVVQGPKIAVL
jgi:hypothetical protein